jgi:glycosyltransferase involved in cell wall biosynthesis
MRKPLISVVIAARNMERELPRTLYTLRASYQSGVVESDYEVVVVDCGSTVPVQPESLNEHGGNFRLLRFDDSPSPARSLNQAVRGCSSEIVMLCIDGARMLSPGILRFALEAFKARQNPVVATLAWHLGPKFQGISMFEGYNQIVEDGLLESIDWRADGYELFRTSSFAGSSAQGWLLPIGESNCLAVRRGAFDRLGGFDERFQSPGGGLVNLDFYKRACEEIGDLVVLLGEGTFHQFHGGVSTNISLEHPNRQRFLREYIELKGYEYIRPATKASYLGGIPPQALPFLAQSVSQAMA